MIKFSYNQNKDEIASIIKEKAKQKNLKMIINKNKVQVFLDSEKYSAEENAIPVCFQGKMKTEDNRTILKGRITYGFYLYTLVIVAAIFIVLRFLWSLSKNQTDNMILCAIVTVVLVIVVIFVNYKAKKAKNILLEFLENLK